MKAYFQNVKHNLRSAMFVWQENSLQRRSAQVEFFVFCSFYNWHIVVAIILCDEAYGWPVILMVVWIVGDKLLRVCLVQSVNLNGTLQGVAQQEHLHLHKKGKNQGDNCTVREYLSQQHHQLLEHMIFTGGVSLWTTCQ